MPLLADCLAFGAPQEQVGADARVEEIKREGEERRGDGGVDPWFEAVA